MVAQKTEEAIQYFKSINHKNGEDGREQVQLILRTITEAEFEQRGIG